MQRVFIILAIIYSMIAVICRMPIRLGPFTEILDSITARQGDPKRKKILTDFGGYDTYGIIDSFKMSPHLTCLGSNIGFNNLI